MPANEQQIDLFFAYVNENQVDALRTWFAKIDIDSDIKSSLMFSKYSGPIKPYCGKTGFGIAAHSGRVDMMETLLESGAFINTPDGNGDYIIHNALTAELIDIGIVKIIVDKLKAIPLAQRTQLNSYGESALSCSVKLPDPDNKLRVIITKLLLDAKIDPNKGEGDNLALIAAISLKHEHRNHKIVKILLDGEADEMGVNGNSLKIAACEGYIEAAKMIVDVARQKHTLSALLEDADEIITAAYDNGESGFVSWFNGLKSSNGWSDNLLAQDAVVPNTGHAYAAAHDGVGVMGIDSEEG